jgi:hypothetical protein
LGGKCPNSRRTPGEASTTQQQNGDFNSELTNNSDFIGIELTKMVVLMKYNGIEWGFNYCDTVNRKGGIS